MKVLLIVNKSYAEDPRAQRAVTALSAHGHQVDVIAFRDRTYREPDLPGVRFLPVPIARSRRNRLAYLFEFAFYSVYCFLASAYLTLTRRHDILQVFAMPEAISLVTFLPKLWGTRIVIDWMDLGHEVYLTKYPRRRLDPFPWLIRRCEHLVGAAADLVLFPNQGFHDAVTERGVKLRRVAIVMNAADEQLFAAPPSAAGSGNGTRVIYTGSMDARNGWDVAIDAIERVAADHPEVQLTLVGDGPDRGLLERRLRDSAGHGRIRYEGRVPLDQLAERIREAGIGIIPTRSTPFNRTNLPTRIFEFGTVGTAVVASDLKELRRYFPDDCVAYCEAGQPGAFARRLRELVEDPQRCEQLRSNLRARCGEYSWANNRRVYLDALEALV